MNLKAKIQREYLVKLAFFVAALGLMFWTVVKVSNLLVSVISAIVVFYLVAPFVNFFERKGFSRLISTIIPFASLSLVLFVSTQILTPVFAEQAATLKEQFPKYSEAINDLITKIESQVDAIASGFYEANLKEKYLPQVTSWVGAFVGRIPDYLSQSLTVLILTPFLAFFMLFEGRIFMKKLIALVPNNIFESFLNLQFQIGEQMGGFVRAKILQSIIVGVVTFVGLLFLNFPYALVLAIVAGVLNIIPYLGPILAFIPAVIIHIANGSSNELLFGLILVYVIAQILDTVIITPFVVAKIVDMHPVTVVLVVLVGAQFMGILGMIICIPLYSALKVTTLAVYRHLTDFRT
jgi:predicted PurR-regulated permease PerM